MKRNQAMSVPQNVCIVHQCDGCMRQHYCFTVAAGVLRCGERCPFCQEFYWRTFDTRAFTGQLHHMPVRVEGWQYPRG